MFYNDKQLNILLNNVLDFTADLLELGYSKTEALKYSLGFIYNQKERRELNTEQYIELESNYLLKVIPLSQQLNKI